MNVATGRAAPGVPCCGPALRSGACLGTRPSAPRPRGPSPGETHLAPTWGLHPGVSLQASSPPSSLSSKTPWPCLPAQKPRGCAPPGSCSFSGAAPSQALTMTPSVPRSRTATCTCTCAGRTTPTCRVPCTRRTARPASSWAQVGDHRSRTARVEPQFRAGLDGHRPGATLCPLGQCQSIARKPRSPGTSP